MSRPLQNGHQQVGLHRKSYIFLYPDAFWKLFFGVSPLTFKSMLIIRRRSSLGLRSFAYVRVNPKTIACLKMQECSLAVDQEPKRSRQYSAYHWVA